jgi:ribose 5-phosphate isomerase B
MFWSIWSTAVHILMASDHAGFFLKESLKEKLAIISSMSVNDIGPSNNESCDYPHWASKLAKGLSCESRKAYGILICASGIGMSIAANRYKHVRAALCFNEEMSILARRHNDANVIVFGAGFMDATTAFACLQRFLETPFDGNERHRRRVDLLGALPEEEENKI